MNGAFSTSVIFFMANLRPKDLTVPFIYKEFQKLTKYAYPNNLVEFSEIIYVK